MRTALCKMSFTLRVHLKKVVIFVKKQVL